FIMAHDEDIAFNNLIELKKDRVIYRPVSTKNNGQREFRLEVYSVVKRAMAKELQELRNYLWLCEWNIHSIKILSEIECALNAQRHAYRARFITRIEDIAKLSRVEFASLREIVSMSLEEAHGSGREQKALYLFFEVLARYARLYQIDECVGEYIAHRTNGQKWPAYDRHTDCDRKEKQTNFNKIEKQFSRIAARKNAWPALEDIERLKELLEDRKQLDSDREVILLGMTQDLDKVVESIIDQSVSVSQVHTSLDRLQRVFRATT
ncbi:MAG TPA: hypothetical protein QGF02_02590, partial [Candidatus Babeliales bacterium]|nr:hypothetical protein [Candidatus Babeliales bacterium]